MSHRLLPLLLLVTACSADERRVPPPAPAPPPALSLATQSDLGRELDDADRLGTWTEVKRRWQGQQLRWTVTLQRALCRSAETCNVAAFPVQRPATHGWMPLMKFAPGEYEKLQATCGTADQCVFTFEGRLGELDVSGEFATKLTFSDVKIVAAERIAAR